MAESGARILLVDDEEAILKLLRFPLEKEGYQVVTARDGDEALETFTREDFDLVILDLMLPHVDGMEVCRRIRAQSIVPIIMLTAKSDEFDKRVLEGGTHSINVRIVTPKDAPLAHAASLDIWLVQAGSATAVTGGELLDAKKRPNSDDVAGSTIKGGTEQPLKPGDVLYVPPGVPHGFKDINGFRAFLIAVGTPRSGATEGP